MKNASFDKACLEQSREAQGKPLRAMQWIWRSGHIIICIMSMRNQPLKMQNIELTLGLRITDKGLKVGGGLGAITLSEIGDALSYDRDHIASTFSRDAMSFIDDFAGLPLKFRFDGHGELHALVMPLKNTHGETLFLSSDKLHAMHSDSGTRERSTRVVYTEFLRGGLCAGALPLGLSGL